MKHQELKEKIIKVIKEYPVGSIATIKSQKPWVRYMACQVEDDLTIYTTAFVSSRKIEQINENCNIHVIFGLDSKNWNLPFVNIEATARVLTDFETKKKCWSDMLSQFFNGPEDPNYVVVKIHPSIIEYIRPGMHKPEIYVVSKSI